MSMSPSISCKIEFNLMFSNFDFVELSNLLNLLSDTSTRGYEYNQICVRIHVIMDSQIPVDTRLATPLRARDGFYP